MRLDGAERYARREPEEPRRRQRESLIEKANQVPIATVLRDFFGTYVPEDLASSWKTRCPFGFEHADGGIDPNFRVYPTNTCYCFAMHGGMGPVRLVMTQRDLPPTRAAQVLAERYGLEQREPYWEKMARLLVESEASGPNVGSPQHAVEAMQQSLDRLPGYAERQYDEEILTTVEERLEGLDAAIRSRTEGSVRAWLHETIRLVSERLEEKQ